MSSITGAAVTDGRHAEAAGMLAGLADADVLAVMGACLDRLGRAPLDLTLDDTAVLAGAAGLQRLENRVHAQKLRWLAEVRERQAYRQAAARSAEDWLVRYGLTRGEAHAQVASTQVLTTLPGTAAKAHAGDLGAGHLQAAARTLNRLPDLADAAGGDAGERGGVNGAGGPDAPAEPGGDDDGVIRDAQPFDPRLGLDQDPDQDAGADRDWAAGGFFERLDQARRELDDLIVEQGEGTDRAKLGRELDRFEHDRGGDAIRERDRRGRARRKLWFGRVEGMRRMTIELPELEGQQVETNVRRLGRRDGPGDARRPEQRLADAAYRLLVQPLAAGADPDDPDAAMAAMPGPAAQVLVITTAAALAGDADAEQATVDGVGPISDASLQLACCDAETTDVVVDARGNPLHLGRSRRTVTDRLRKGVLVRDRVCVGCGADASCCQVHHVEWWEHGGRTDICRMCLLCWDCHHNVHHNGWICYRLPDGGYTAQPPHEAPPPGGIAVEPACRRRR